MEKYKKTIIEIERILKKNKINKREFEGIYQVICHEYDLKALFPEMRPYKTEVMIQVTGKCEDVSKDTAEVLEKFFDKMNKANGEI